MNFALHFQNNYSIQAVALFGSSTGSPVQIEGSVICDGGRWVFEADLDPDKAQLWGEMSRAKLTRALKKWDGMSPLPVLEVEADVLLSCQPGVRWFFASTLVQEAEVKPPEHDGPVGRSYTIKVRLSPDPKPSFHVSFEKVAS